MRQLFIAFFMLFAASSAHAETRDPLSYFFQPKFGDFKAELQAAREQGKMVAYNVGAITRKSIENYIKTKK